MRRSKRRRVRSIASYFWVLRRTSRQKKLKSRTLFIVAREDTQRRRPKNYRASVRNTSKAPQPKELIVLEGSAHAPVPFPNRSKRSRHARDRAIPLDALIVRLPGEC